jgi:hypothetical protein
MIVRVYEDRPWSDQYNVLVLEEQIQNQSGTYSVTLSRSLAQSDRCYNGYPADDDRAWAYHVGLTTTIDLALTVTGSKISVEVSAFRDWMVERVPGGAPAGDIAVPGNYTWTSSLTGNVIYHYYYPDDHEEAGWGYESYPGTGGTTSFSTGTLNPQQESSATEFANMYNGVNQTNRSYAKIVIFNDFPPDYRPGQCLHSSVWESHNRDGGSANILTGGSWVDNVYVGGIWTEMRTEENGHDNPPLIRRNNGWDNQAKIGHNA